MSLDRLGPSRQRTLAISLSSSSLSARLGRLAAAKARALVEPFTLAVVLTKLIVGPDLPISGASGANVKTGLGRPLGAIRQIERPLLQCMTGIFRYARRCSRGSEDQLSAQSEAEDLESRSNLRRVG